MSWIEYVKPLLAPILGPSVKQSTWVRNSEEIILLMSCLYADLTVLSISVRWSRISGEGVSHGAADGRMGVKASVLGACVAGIQAVRGRIFRVDSGEKIGS